MQIIINNYLKHDKEYGLLSEFAKKFFLNKLLKKLKKETKSNYVSKRKYDGSSEEEDQKNEKLVILFNFILGKYIKTNKK